MLASGLRRTWFHLLGAGPLVLLLSVLPSYVYFDHLVKYASQAMGQQMGEDTESAAEHTSHEQHCHYGGGGCSEAPAPINGRVLPAVVDLIEPQLAAVLLEENRPLLAGVAVVPQAKPPRADA